MVRFHLKLAKEREEEMAKNQEKEQALREKKTKSASAQKVYAAGVGKYINPTIKKDARQVTCSVDFRGFSCIKGILLQKSCQRNRIGGPATKEKGCDVFV